MCVNYGGRTELTDAIKLIASEVKAKRLNPESITEKTLEKFMYNAQMRDVDMFLRTSGEMRTSNFLPWQSVYAEMVFMDVLWPDVDLTTLWDAIAIYNQRERRFGKA